MPSRFSLTSEPQTVQDHFGYVNSHEFPPREVIAPTEPVMIVRRGHSGKREVHLVRWGLIPPWVRDLDKFGTMSVARAETVLEKASFRGGIRHKRCIVPANGFYVWSGKAGAKRRHLVRADDGRIMGIAAIYEEWMAAEGSEIDSMALLTVSAKPPVVAKTERVPALVHPQDFASWLDCRNVRAEEAMPLLDVGTSGSFNLS